MHRFASGLVIFIALFTLQAFAAEPHRPSINQAALDKLGWKLGCQAYTFRSISLMETLDVLKSLGIHYLEIYPGQRFSKDDSTRVDQNMPLELIEQFKRKLAADDITVVSYGVVGLSNDEAQDRKVFDFAKKLGLKTIVSEPPADALGLIDRLCAEYRVKMAIHDHPKPTHYWNCDTVLNAIRRHSDRIGACADVGHWERSGLVPVECLRKLQGRIIELHFKDINQQKIDVPWGQGTVNVAGCMAEIKRQHARPFFFIEYEEGSGPELIANVAKSIQFFSDQATRLAAEN